MKIGSARNLVMFNFTGLSFLAHVAERHRRAGWVARLGYGAATPIPPFALPQIIRIEYLHISR